MTQIPPDELSTLQGLPPGSTICELGNKKNSTGLYRDWYTSLGCHYVCVDWNGLDGAVPLDMRYSVTPGDVLSKLELELDHPLRQAQQGFDFVTNFGFTEHVTNQHRVWGNIHNLVRVGGNISICLPYPFPGFKTARPNWETHGFWQPTLEWMGALADANNYEVLFTASWKRVRPTIIARWIKQTDDPFLWIDKPMHRTKLKMGEHD